VEVNIASSYGSDNSHCVIKANIASSCRSDNLLGLLKTGWLGTTVAMWIFHFCTFVLKYRRRLRTAQGEEITIRIDNGRVYANGAKIIDSDFITNNGVIHVLDGYGCHVGMRLPEANV